MVDHRNFVGVQQKPLSKTLDGIVTHVEHLHKLEPVLMIIDNAFTKPKNTWSKRHSLQEQAIAELINCMASRTASTTGTASACPPNELKRCLGAKASPHRLQTDECLTPIYRNTIYLFTKENKRNAKTHNDNMFHLFFARIHIQLGRFTEGRSRFATSSFLPASKTLLFSPLSRTLVFFVPLQPSFASAST